MTAVVFSDAPAAQARTVAVSAYALDPFDLEVLDLVAHGLSDPEIAERLGVTRSRAKDAVARLGAALQAQGRAGIVAKAYRRGLLLAPNPVPDGRGVLTPEQFQILGLIAAGLSGAQIADALGVSVDQAKYRLSGLLKALGARGKEHAIKRAVDLGALTLVPRGGVS